MTDYNKLTVAKLRELLKDRSIPSTGLTRKAQIIEKLEEEDKKSNTADAQADDAPPPVDAPDDAQPEVAEVETAPEKGEETAPVAAELAIEGDEAPEPEETAEAPTEDPSLAETTTEPKSHPTEPVDTQIAPAAEQTEEPKAPADIDVPSITETPPEGQSATELVAAPPELPMEQEPRTQVTDFADKDRASSAAPNELPSTEKSELLPIPERSTTASRDGSRLNSEELEADNKKRKRRSDSPDLSTQDVKAKKPRPSKDFAPEVHLKEDKDVVMEERAPEDEKPLNAPINGHNEPEREELEAKPANSDSKSSLEAKSKGPRYRDLFQPTAAADATSSLHQDDRPTVPALHPVTPALYVRNLMRPLRPDQLRKHLVSIASPPSADPDPSLIQDLFLDSMKTHAFVLLTSTNAASRVRASLHRSVWPPERNRQELWVDFIPEDKVLSWIKEEEDAITAEKDARAAGRPIPTKKFEVVYDNDEDGVIQAIFQEVGSSAPSNAPKGPRADYDARRPSAQQSIPQAPIRESREDVEKKKETQEKSFQTLDSLFQSTTAKPKLYFLPVDDSVSEARLKELELETSRDWRPEDRVRGRGRNRLDQKMAFSFDSDNRLIEVGGDFGPWAEDSREGGFPRGGRGGFRGRGPPRGGGDRGGYYGRGR
ncbi:hypothetical protein BDV96DRAFT_497466 [Lophiotrema nucula]|uniref:SAP domain-containing protein n=1 Tax=Lophiotrema nucula TaxID=690887 RepID=A0A6A5Z137_9PLEO|nr:hypothetical protein BDV96DRAFT_497466 [Lophiotrema nucula]